MLLLPPFPKDLYIENLISTVLWLCVGLAVSWGFHLCTYMPVQMGGCNAPMLCFL